MVGIQKVTKKDFRSFQTHEFEDMQLVVPAVIQNGDGDGMAMAMLLFILEPLKAIAYQNSGFVYCHITQQIPETPLRALQFKVTGKSKE